MFLTPLPGREQQPPCRNDGWAQGGQHPAGAEEGKAHDSDAHSGHQVYTAGGSEELPIWADLAHHSGQEFLDDNADLEKQSVQSLH